MEVFAYLVDRINEILFKPCSILRQSELAPLRTIIKRVLAILGVYSLFFRDEAVNDFLSG
jgi:hypothetical protein